MARDGRDWRLPSWWPQAASRATRGLGRAARQTLGQHPGGPQARPGSGNTQAPQARHRLPSRSRHSRERGTRIPRPTATVDFSLQPNHTFTWTVSSNGQNQSFSGTYTQDGNDLVLTRSDGQKMEGLVSMTGSNELRFRLKNGNPNDPGLQFSK